ncbi:discoidin domain-containing protein [Kribbella sp. NBC_01245]|uniref:glycoside hydrolase domain-containing protein n=1 Tax=Kribbella sp. NBC_01245 TaxID=2903578 RepID=UPI002E2B8B0D|nr:glycoside hydrolase domain-containing protein [Kribbella sp. NBC_01245]
MSIQTTSAQPAAAALPTPTGIWTESAYTSVFQDSHPSAEAGSTLRLDTARNEYEGGQIVLRRNEATTISGVTFSELRSATGTISPGNLEYKFVKHVDLNANSVFGGNQPVYPVIRKAPAKFPDTLSNELTTTVPARTTQPIWIRAFVPPTTPGGLYQGTATVSTTQGDTVVPVEIDVRAVTLPEASNGSYTNVMWNLFGGEINADQEQPDTIKQFYGHDKYSPQWWALLDNVTKEWKAHRTNNLTVPVLRLLLDAGSRRNADGTYHFNWSRLDQLVDFVLARGGIKRIEGFWLAGGPGYWTKWDVGRLGSDGKLAWSPWDDGETDNWLRQFVPALKNHVAAKGWTDKWWMHVGDEPQGDHGKVGWEGVAKKVRAHWPDVKIGDAMFHDPWASALAPQTDIMIPNLMNYSQRPTAWDQALAPGKELWIYNCNIPTHNFLNRFIDQPQWHQRQTAWFAYSRGATGYLHWAFNNWRFKLDSQEVKGDGYIVLPDADPARNTLQTTVRYESLRDGIEDYEVLNLLGKTDPALAKNLAAGLVPLGDKYTPDTNYIQRVRRYVLDAAEGRAITDVARTATATASSGVAQNAIDGEASTNWQPDGAGTLQLDLGRQTQVDVLKLTWSNPAAVKLSISYDAAKWTVVPASARASALNVKTRYLKLETTGGLASVEVNGAALARTNVAGGKIVKTPAAPVYPDSSGIESTDGVLADAYGDGLTHGYAGPKDGKAHTVELTIDLSSVKQVDTAKLHAYEEYPSYRPDQVQVLTSVDGQRFVQRASRRTADGAANVWYDLRFGSVPARFVKVALTKTYTEKANVMFVGEIEVYETDQQAANLAWGRTYTKTATHLDPAYADAGGESTDGKGAGGYTDGLGYGYHLPVGTHLKDVTIDLGSTRNVSRARAAAFSDGVHDYAPDKVQVIANGNVVAESIVHVDGWYDLTFPAVETRNLTLRFTKTHGYFADYLFLDEIEAYGSSERVIPASYTSSAPKDPPYQDTGSESTDGILAGHYTDGLSYAYQFTPGTTGTATVDLDLGVVKPISRVAVREYLDGVHNYRPDQVVVLTSTNGTDFTELARMSAPTARWFDLAFSQTEARYVQVRMTKTWGSYAEYIFVDEINVS